MSDDPQGEVERLRLCSNLVERASLLRAPDASALDNETAVLLLEAEACITLLADDLVSARVDPKHQALAELDEIADGAWGDGPRTRGLAKRKANGANAKPLHQPLSPPPSVWENNMSGSDAGDLVKRLEERIDTLQEDRKHAIHTNLGNALLLHTEAAASIAALSEENERLKAALGEVVNPDITKAGK